MFEVLNRVTQDTMKLAVDELRGLRTPRELLLLLLGQKKMRTVTDSSNTWYDRHNKIKVRTICYGQAQKLA